MQRRCIHLIWSQIVPFPVDDREQTADVPASYWFEDKAFVDVPPVRVWVNGFDNRQWGGFPVDDAAGGTSAKNAAGKVAAALTVLQRNVATCGSGWMTSGLAYGFEERTVNGQRHLKIRWPTGRPTPSSEELEYAKHVPATFRFQGRDYTNEYPVETDRSGTTLIGWFAVANGPASTTSATYPTVWASGPWQVKHMAYNLLRFRFEILDRTRLLATVNPSDRTPQGHARLIPHHYEVQQASLSPDVLVVDGPPTEVVDWLFPLGNRWNIVGEWDVPIPPPRVVNWKVDGYWAKHGPDSRYPTYIDIVYLFSPQRAVFWREQDMGYTDQMIVEQLLKAETQLVPRNAAAGVWDGTLRSLREDFDGWRQRPYLVDPDREQPWYGAVFRVYASAKPSIPYKSYAYSSDSVLDGERAALTMAAEREPRGYPQS